MRIAFIDPGGWNYAMDAPYERPMGGSISALCYLAPELAQLGHAVTVLNGVRAAAESRGVHLQSLSAARSAAYLNAFDALVLVGLAQGRVLRRNVGVTVPMVLWTPHAHDQPAVRELSRQNERWSWTGFAFVSDWQRQCYEKFFQVPREKGRVLRNAVSPAFAQDFAQANDAAPWFAAGEPPVLFYTSTPFRGLDVLLRAFPAIRAELPGTRLRVYSSMGVYQIGAADDKYRALYDQCRSMEGVDYIGSVGQSRLAKELAGAAALAYPSTFAETSCIAALEAMAVGAAVLTTRLGALPETTAGLASMVEWQADEGRLAASFAAMAVAALRDMRHNPAASAARRDQRIKFIRDNYLWAARAREWEQWLTQIASARLH
jgi:glycosyltransferase involved in cell wall biosynthesis